MKFKPYDFDKYGVKQYAELVYEVDYRTFNIFYKNKEEAVKALSNRNLWDLKEHNDKEYVYAILDDDETLIGICNGTIGFNYNTFKSIIGLFFILKFKDAIKQSLILFLDSFVLVDVGPNDFYIGEIAIFSSQRGKGYGKTAILKLIEIAHEKGCDCVILDADFRNDGAYRLYKSIGFEVFDKKCFKIPFFKRGMRSMKYKLK
ncbi:MAG: GNAT family N-acetyltransferase [archaeon]|nr:GNAT family N-acetyltransferase [archaeon]